MQLRTGSSEFSLLHDDFANLLQTDFKWLFFWESFLTGCWMQYEDGSTSPLDLRMGLLPLLHIGYEKFLDDWILNSNLVLSCNWCYILLLRRAHLLLMLQLGIPSWCMLMQMLSTTCWSTNLWFFEAVLISGHEEATEDVTLVFPSHLRMCLGISLLAAIEFWRMLLPLHSLFSPSTSLSALSRAATAFWGGGLWGGL